MLRAAARADHRLKILVKAGIFTLGKRGGQAYCALVPLVMDALSAVLSTTSQDLRPACPVR